MANEIREDSEYSAEQELNEKPEFGLGSGLLIVFVWLLLLPVSAASLLFLAPLTFLTATLFAIGWYRLTTIILARRRWNSDRNVQALIGKWLAVTGIFCTISFITFICVGLYFVLFPLLYFPPVLVGGLLAISRVLKHCREKKRSGAGDKPA
jgi:hypothetical protein